MLEVMTQATRIAHLDHPFGDWPRAFTAVPADVMGLADHGRLKVGAPADLVLLSARFMSEMLSRSQADRVVLRGGRADRHLPARLSRARRAVGRAGVIPAADPAFRAALDGLELIDHPVQLRQRSRDFYWYSPILKARARRQGGRPDRRAAHGRRGRARRPPPAPASACRWWCAAAPPATTARWCRCRAACCSTWRGSIARSGSSAAAAASRPACAWATPMRCARSRAGNCACSPRRAGRRPSAAMSAAAPPAWARSATASCAMRARCWP